MTSLHSTTRLFADDAVIYMYLVMKNESDASLADLQLITST